MPLKSSPRRRLCHVYEDGVVRVTVSTNKSMCWEIGDDDMQEPLEEHNNDLTTEELADLENEEILYLKL